MSQRQNYCDLDPTYKDAWGQPVLRITFDFPPNDLKMAAYVTAKAVEIGKAMGAKQVVGNPRKGPYTVTQYQTTRHVEEALARLTEAYMTIGIVGEAQTAAAVLGHNFPDSRWYKDAYNLVKSGGYEPNENEGSYISKAFKKLGLG